MFDTHDVARPHCRRERTTAVRHALPFALALIALAGAFDTAEAQGGFLGRLGKRASDAAGRKVEERTERRAGEATDAALDKAECAASDAKCRDAAARNGQPAAGASNGQAAAGASNGQAATGARNGAAASTVNVNSDFTPGTRVLFTTDFARDEVGDFPRRLELKQGNMEVAEVDGARMLRATSTGEFEIPLSSTLPEMFTLEFDFVGPDAWTHRIYFTPSDNGHYVAFRPTLGGIEGPAGYSATGKPARGAAMQPLKVQVMADGNYVKVYLNGTRVANAPNAPLGRSRVIRVRMVGTGDSPAHLTNIRVAAGGKDLYRALETDGRVTAEGIFFDTNSDRIKPESTPALDEIGKMLVEHPELSITVEGHTDDVGGAAKNMTLSEQRAAAVKAYLTSRHGIAAGRLTARGFGSTKPAVPNSSDANRAKNRRVELVKR